MIPYSTIVILVPLRQILNEDSGSVQFHLIAGLLNASYFDKNDADYFLTVQQFWDLYDGTLEIPNAYSSLKDMISANYHQTPGSDCEFTVGG